MTIDEMTKQKVKAQLIQEKESLQKRVEELRVQDPYSDPARLNDNAASDTDANEESSHERYQAMMHNVELRMSDIETALVELEAGTVSLERLEALFPSVKQLLSE